MFRSNSLILSIFISILILIYYRIYWRAHERRSSETGLEERDTIKKTGWINLVKDFDEMTEDETHPPVKPTQNLNRPDYLLDAQECMKEMFFSRTDRDIWEDFSRIVMNCTPYDEMRIKIYSNSFRYHYFQKPARYEDNEFLKTSCQLVSIGTNVDVKAELTFSENYPNCKFLGVDPNATEKEAAYKQVGKFVNALVTTDGKTKESTVIKGSKIIDVLWMDNEYEEYDLLPLFLKDSPLFRDAWRICQIQVEIHGHLEKPEIIGKYAKFVKAMFEEGRYLPVHSMQSVHIIAFFFNFGDDECFQRYIETFNFFSGEFYPINY